MAQKLDIQPIEDEELDIQPLDIQPVNAPDKPSLASRVWNKISSPLTDAPSRVMRQVSDYITDPSEGDSILGAQLRGFLGGSLEGVGDILSQATSPIDLASMIASGGASLAVKQGLKTPARVLGGVSALANTGMTAHGAGNVISPDSTLAERGFGLLEMAGGIPGVGHGVGIAKGNAQLPIKPPGRVFDEGLNPGVTNAPLPVKPIIGDVGEWEPPSFMRQAQSSGDEVIPALEGSPISMEGQLPIRPDIPIESNIDTFIAPANKHPYKLHNDGTYTDLETGENKPINPSKATPSGETLDIQPLDDAPIDIKPRIDELTQKVKDGTVTQKEVHELSTLAAENNKTQTGLPPAEVLTPEVMPSRTDINNMENGPQSDDAMQSMRMDVHAKSTDDESLQTVDEINRNRLTRKQNGVSGTKSDHREARIIEMELNKRGLQGKLVPEPFNTNTPPSPQQLNPQESTLLTGKPDPKLITPPIITDPIPPVVHSLPKELQGAKPRFQTHVTEFESDIDKAAFIISQKTKSKRDLDYLDFVMKSTGLDEAGARALGQKVRAQLKDLSKLSDDTHAPIKLTSNHGNILPDKISPNPVQPTTSDVGNVRNSPDNGVDTNIPDKSKNSIPTRVNKPTHEEIRNKALVISRTKKIPFDDARKLAETELSAKPTVPKNEKLAPGNLPPNKPPTAPVDLSQIPSEMSKVNKIGALTPEPKKASMYRKAADEIRTLLTSFDFSAPGRQGMPLMLRKEYWTSIDDMFKAWGSDKAFNSINESIQAGDNFKPIYVVKGESKSLADIAGLDLTDTKLNPEEMMRGTYVAKYIPGVERSQRAYAGFLNKLRADTFNSLVDAMKREGRDPNLDHVAAKKLGDFINNATGRGSLGKLEKASEELTDVFFAPKLMASRIRMYNTMFNPKSYIDADPVLRKEALKSLFSVVGIGSGIGQLSRMAGAQIESDPRSSDFGKIRIGDTRIDPFAGFQQYAVGAARIISGKSKSATSGNVSDLTSGKYGQRNRADVVESFFTNKLAPVPSFVYAWLKNTEFDGEPFEVKQAIINRTVPILLQDLHEISKEDPKLLPLAVLPVFGVGVQSYGR